MHLIDYGLAKKIAASSKKSPNYFEVVGTLKFASINALKGCEQSRRDDLESLGYTLVYLIKGALPWQTFLNENSNSFNNTLLQKKESIPVDELCHGIPKEFSFYLRYVRNLKFEDIPDYKYLSGLLYEARIKYEMKKIVNRKLVKLTDVCCVIEGESMDRRICLEQIVNRGMYKDNNSIPDEIDLNMYTNMPLRSTYNKMGREVEKAP